MNTYKLELFADYFQFYLQDETVTGDLSDSWNEEAISRLLAITDGTIGVGTVRNAEVPVEIVIADRETNEDLTEWDKVNECSISIPSGKIIIAGCMDYLPDAKRIDVPKGIYRARIYYGKLNKISEDGLEGEDNYKIVLWMDSAYREIIQLK